MTSNLQEKMKIKSVSITSSKKEFAYYKDEEENKLKSLKELGEFKKGVIVISEEELNGYREGIILHYYVGNVIFFPVKEGGSSITMNIKLTKDMLNTIVTMCLDTVCDLCEKQTKAFQNSFVRFVEDNSESLTNETKKIKDSLVARGLKKVLTIEGKDE